MVFLFPKATDHVWGRRRRPCRHHAERDFSFRRYAPRQQANIVASANVDGSGTRGLASTRMRPSGGELLGPRLVTPLRRRRRRPIRAVQVGMRRWHRMTLSRTGHEVPRAAACLPQTVFVLQNPFPSSSCLSVWSSASRHQCGAAELTRTRVKSATSILTNRERLDDRLPLWPRLTGIHGTFPPPLTGPCYGARDRNARLARIATKWPNTTARGKSMGAPRPSAPPRVGIPRIRRPSR